MREIALHVIIAPMEGRLPLPTLLSKTLVAFTIEFDNESEHRMPHQTTNHGSTGDSLHDPWLVSSVMWTNGMPFLGEQGLPVRELVRRAWTTTNLVGMGYIVVEPNPTDPKPKPPRSAWVVRATFAGRKAQEVWRPLFGVIEKRWQERFDKNEIGQLRESPWAVASQLAVEPPDGLPILGYGLCTKDRDYEGTVPGRDAHGSSYLLPLSALLSRVLLRLAIEFERESDLSPAISAYVVSILDEKGVRIRDLPLLSGVTKEAISMALGFLRKRRLAVVEADRSGSRRKVARLTPRGGVAQNKYRRRLSDIEQRWDARFGKHTIRTLRGSLEQLVGEPAAQQSPLFRGLEPDPDGWRASVPRPDTLPHYLMVLHRGGFPDGR